jgi:hypothetical protein
MRLMKSLLLITAILLVIGSTTDAWGAKKKTQKSMQFQAVEMERLQFNSLIEKNPNYFGTIKQSKLKAKKFFSMSTKYEELTCVGLYPEINMLEAIFKVKKSYGFSGKLCKKGSKEYVAFYIDYGDGAGYVSTGAPAVVKVHNLTAINSGHIYYAAKKTFTPKQLLHCSTPQVVKVKAILSWQTPPVSSGFIPVWGNVLERWVQIKPKPSLFVLPNKLAADKMVLMGNKNEIKEFLAHADEAEKLLMENPGKVEEERFQFKALIKKNINYFGAITKSKSSQAIKMAVTKLPSNVKKLYLAENFQLETLVPVFPMWYNTSYEELKCVGLFPEEDLLEAVIEIKKPFGFNGPLCPPGGSNQYVSFYIDWGSGSFGATPVVTEKVRTYDIPSVSEHHLFYAVRAKIPKDIIKEHLKECSIENVVRVRAILSWNFDASSMGPNYHPAYGNVLTRRIQLRPSTGQGVTCEIQTVNQVLVEHITQSGSDKGLAINPDSTAVLYKYDKPFGGLIAIHGKINIANAAYYRFLFSEDNGASWVPVKDKLRYPNPLFPFIGPVYYTINPDSDGWINKSQYDSQKNEYDPLAMSYWNSSGKNSLCTIKLEVGDNTKTLLACNVNEVIIQLDNIGPQLIPFSDSPSGLPASGVVIKNSAGVPAKCGKFVGKAQIKVYGNFYDKYFNAFSMKVFGGNISSSGQYFGKGNYDSLTTNGQVYERDFPTAGMPWVLNAGLGTNIDSVGILGASSSLTPSLGRMIGELKLCNVPQSPEKVDCAYGIFLYVSDKAIVGHWGSLKYNYSTTSHGRSAYVTFNWNPKGCN